MTTGERIRRRRKELDISAEQLADLLGVSPSTIYRYENGDIEKCPSYILEPLAKYLRTSPAYLMGWEDTGDPTATYDNLLKIETRRFPLLGNIACGTPIYADQEYELLVEAGSDIQADFCLRCSGDSMIGARIYDGDIVFIRKQDMVNNGDIAAVIIGDEATLKRVQYDRENNTLSLFAENPMFKTLRYSGEQLDHIRILGKAVAFQSVLR